MANSNGHQHTWRRFTQGAPLAVLLAATLYILYRLLPVLKLIAVALLIAVILKTVFESVEKLVKVRWLAMLVVVGLVVGAVVLLVAIVVPGLLDEIQTLLTSIPNYLSSLITLSVNLHQSFRFVPDLSQGLTEFRNFSAQILNSFPLLLQQAFNVTIETVAMLILALYIAYDPDALINGILRLIPRRHHARIRRVLGATEVKLQGWMWGTGIAMLFLGCATTIGLWILGIPLALAFGVIAGLFEVIPYFGSIFGTFLPALVALTISPWKLLLVVVLFAILNQVDAYLVQPLVMGQQVKLHPVMVILTFLIMGKLLGFIGILLAVPTVAIIVTLIDEFTENSLAPVEPAPVAKGIDRN
jgi:predicted PurR-regulated permease PerM